MNISDRTLRVTSALVCMSAAAFIAVACSNSDTTFADSKPSEQFTDDAGPATTTPPVDASTCEGPSGVHCSRDLKQVLTGCEGQEEVVFQCNQDQGCADGACVDACKAAEVSKGSVGCDFWTVVPDDPQNYKGSCFAAMVANTWDRPISITAEYGSDALDVSGSIYTVERDGLDPKYNLLEGPLPAGQVAIVFLANDKDSTSSQTLTCPAAVNPAYLHDPIRHGTGKTKAFHVKTDAPVAAYSIYPYGGMESYIPSATLLLPVTSWEKDYVAVSPYDFGNTRRKRTLQLIANEDGTEITIRPTVEVPMSATTAGATTGVAQTWTLNRGEVLQFTQAAMTGSPISTNKPIGMFGGAVCTELPGAYCDMLNQQIAPFGQWGSKYAFVPFKPRMETFEGEFHEKVPYSIVGAVDGTVLEYSPSKPLGAPETINAGESANFITDELFVVKSQDSKHPFYSSVYMTGSTYGSGTGKRTTGDPDFVNIPPTDQFLDRYVFFTDYTYPNTTLTFVRKKTSKGFMPVELECAGEVENFKPLGTDGEFEYAWVQLTEGFVGGKFEKGQCGYGRQEAHSTGPFTVTVWGTGLDASYGYVGGTGLRPINDATPQIIR